MSFTPLSLIPLVRADAWPRGFITRGDARGLLRELLMLGEPYTAAQAALELDENQFMARLLGAELTDDQGGWCPALSVRGFLRWLLRFAPPRAPDGRDSPARPVLLRWIANVERRLGPLELAAFTRPGTTPFQALLAGNYSWYAAPAGPAELRIFVEHMEQKLPELARLYAADQPLSGTAFQLLQAATQDELLIAWYAPAWPYPVPAGLRVGDVLKRLMGAAR